MGAHFSPWQSAYLAAVLETNDAELHARINTAEAAIQMRYQSNEPDDLEARALRHAMNSLRVLRKERVSG